MQLTKDLPHTYFVLGTAVQCSEGQRDITLGKALDVGEHTRTQRVSLGQE